MASIQVLELRPVEDQIKDLSYDMTDSIRGGASASAIIDCLATFWDALAAAESVDDVFTAQAALIECLEPFFV